MLAIGILHMCDHYLNGKVVHVQIFDVLVQSECARPLTIRSMMGIIWSCRDSGKFSARLTVAFSFCTRVFTSGGLDISDQGSREEIIDPLNIPPPLDSPS